MEARVARPVRPKHHASLFAALGPETAVFRLRPASSGGPAALFQGCFRRPVSTGFQFSLLPLMIAIWENTEPSRV